MSVFCHCSNATGAYSADAISTLKRFSLVTFEKCQSGAEPGAPAETNTARASAVPKRASGGRLVTTTYTYTRC